jgi:hypothetical protein
MERGAWRRRGSSRLFPLRPGLGEASYRDLPFPRAMPRRELSDPGSADTQRRELAAVRRQLQRLERAVLEQDQRLRTLAKSSEAGARRQAVVYEALQLGESAKKGERGVIRELQDSVERLEDYLLKTADRIETILSALKQHRELLVSVNKRVLEVGTKDRIRLELDVMKNTLSILSLNGVEFDSGLVKEIDSLRARVRQSEDLAQLEQAKVELDKKFDGELKKFDLDAIWSRKKEIAGYR